MMSRSKPDWLIFKGRKGNRQGSRFLTIVKCDIATDDVVDPNNTVAKTDLEDFTS
jgi:hypothetical protein